MVARNQVQLLRGRWSLSIVAGLPGAWFTVVLAFCGMTVWAAYGIRALFSWQALASLALFFAMVVASNSWQLVPMPTEPDEEAWRLWVIYAKEAKHTAFLLMLALALGLAFTLSFGHENRAPTLTYLILFVCVVSQFGEFIEYIVCKINDPALGHEHTYYATGGRKPACGRAMGNLGPLIFPAITAAPLPIILWRTWQKSKA